LVLVTTRLVSKGRDASETDAPVAVLAIAVSGWWWLGRKKGRTFLASYKRGQTTRPHNASSGHGIVGLPNTNQQTRLIFLGARCGARKFGRWFFKVYSTDHPAQIKWVAHTICYSFITSCFRLAKRRGDKQEGKRPVSPHWIPASEPQYTHTVC
jgi:hypothetical protein